MKTICYFLLITLLFNCKPKNNSVSEISENIPHKTEQEIDERFVIAKSGLNFRKKPKGKIIGKFEYAERLEIIEYTDIFESIKDEGKLTKGQWLGVKANNDTVYVFDGFLANKNEFEIIKNAANLQQTKANYEILLPGVYRDWENDNPVNSINSSWLELHKKGSNYYISKAKYSISKGYSECSGDSTKILDSKNKALLFIKDSTLKLGEVTSINFKKDKIWPTEKASFQYKNIDYTIRAEGDVISSEQVHTDEGIELFQKVENYKLYISINNASETLFLEESGFNDTFVKLLFVGDLDSDGKLDFIFQANRDYEEERAILYLSTKASKDEIIKKVAEIAIQFDC